MRRIILFCLILLLAAAFASAEDAEIKIYMSPFVPRSPEVMGQGGSFTAVAEGYSSLFTNPAGFAFKKGSLTLVTANPWVYIRPDQVAETIDLLANSEEANPEMAIIPLINEQITAGGFGIGFSAGLGWAGKGLGLGVISMVDSHIYGNTLLGAAGQATATVGLVGGFAIPLEFFDDLKLTVGGDVRPMYRAYVPMNNSLVIDLLGSLSDEAADPMQLLMGESAYAGVGLGIDLGAMLDVGPFTVGLSVRDLFGTRFSFSESTLQEISDEIAASQSLPTGDPVTDTYLIPMEINLGAAFHPDLGGFSFILDPKVHIDLKDPIGVIRDGMSPWSLLHIGAEAKLLKTLALRAGFYQGYITGGVGLDLLIAEINASFFTIERGQFVGDKPNSGVTLEAALRF